MAKKIKKVEGKIAPQNLLFTNDKVGEVVYATSFKQYWGEVFGGKATAWTSSRAAKGREMAFLCLGHVKAKEPIEVDKAKSALFNMGFVRFDVIEEVLTPTQYKSFIKKLNARTKLKELENEQTNLQNNK